MHNIDYKYFNKARLAAQASDYKRCHVGCVAVYRGHIIGSGRNTNKTHPMQHYYNVYRCNTNNSNLYAKMHAEISCINQIYHLDVNFSKVKLYIYRIRRDQPFGMARPCPSCMMAIKDLGIKKIYYTTNNGYACEKIENNNVGVM